MKILIINSGIRNPLDKGGAETFCMNLHVLFNARLVIYNRSILNNKFLRKILLDYYNPLAYNFIRKLLKNCNLDVIHVNNFYGLSANSIRKISQDYPLIITAHDSWIFNYSKNLPLFINKIHQMIVHKNLKKILIVCPSKFIAKSLKKIGYEKIRIIPNGIDTNKKNANYKKNILFVGRLSKEKGLQTVINTLNNVKGYKVKILGEGILKKKLQQKYKNIKFLGFQKPDKYYKKASILIFPSICEESFGLSTAEAMSYGLCVIGTHIGATPELIKHKKTGLLFKPGNEQDFREKLDYLLQNPKEIKRMGRNARRFVKKSFNWSNIIKEYKKVYGETIREFKKKNEHKN